LGPDVPHDDPNPALERLEALEEIVAALRPVLLAEHSEHGLQGLGGLVGQYQKALADIEQLKTSMAKREATLLDELAAKRSTPTSRSGGPARRRV
jgi:hypothetical protein